MKLVKTTLYSAVITLIRVGSSFVANKVVALFTGPAGVALIGTFTNFITVVLAFANGAINTGVVKYTSEYNSDSSTLTRLFSTAIKISTICSFIIGIVLLVLSRQISEFIFSSPKYATPIIVFGITIVFYSLNSLLVSILNGKGEISKLTLVNTIASLVALLLTVILVYRFKLIGAIYALVLAQSVVFFVTFGLVSKSSWFRLSMFIQKLDKDVAMKLLSFSFMAIISALTGPISQTIIRNYLIENLNLRDAGYWQAMMRVSDGYLLVITTSLSTYYLPKLSQLTDRADIKKEIMNGLKLIVPALLISCTVVYLCRGIIIKILYTPEFSEMESLFFWQLIGDFFKMIAWLLGYLMIAKAMTKTYIISDLLFSALYVLLSIVFVKAFGLIGVTLSFACSYFLYLLLVVFIFRDLLFSKHQNQ